MKKLFKGLLPLLLVLQVCAGDKYKKELRVFTKESEMALAFDKGANPLLREIRQDIQNYKELSYCARLVRFPLLSAGAIVATQESMPLLHAYVQSLCLAHNVAMPTIFITREKHFFGAAAAKLLASTGGIIIGQSLINQASDEELEAVIAHEIGHIKYDHANKNLVIALLTLPLVYYLLSKINSRAPEPGFLPKVGRYFASTFIVGNVMSLVKGLVVGKSFEKQADTFACRDAKKAAGLIAFFNRLESKELQADAQFDTVRAALTAHKDKLNRSDYISLSLNYYMTKGLHLFGKGYKWLYHNTPFGPHPAHRERIAAARTYLEIVE